MLKCCFVYTTCQSLNWPLTKAYFWQLRRALMSIAVVEPLPLWRDGHRKDGKKRVNV